MALQDRSMEETKNAVEAYVHDMRNKLHNELQEFVTNADKEDLLAKLKETEDWLYEDGEDETQAAYIAKLEELKKQGDPIEQRYKEHSESKSFLDNMATLVNCYLQDAASLDQKLQEKVFDECFAAEDWLKEKKFVLSFFPKCDSPKILPSDIRKRAEALDRVCRPIMHSHGVENATRGISSLFI